MLRRPTRRRCTGAGCPRKHAGTPPRGRGISPPPGPGAQVRRRGRAPPASSRSPPHRPGAAVWVCPGEPGRLPPPPLPPASRQGAAGPPPLTSARLRSAPGAGSRRRPAGTQAGVRRGGRPAPAPPRHRAGHSPRRRSQAAPIVRPPPRPAPLRAPHRTAPPGRPAAPAGSGSVARAAAAGGRRSASGGGGAGPCRSPGAGLAPPGLGAPSAARRSRRGRDGPAEGRPRGGTAAPAAGTGREGAPAATGRALRSHRWRCRVARPGPAAPFCQGPLSQMALLVCERARVGFSAP